jgi:hypothetical protein
MEIFTKWRIGRQERGEKKRGEKRREGCERERGREAERQRGREAERERGREGERQRGREGERERERGREGERERGREERGERERGREGERERGREERGSFHPSTVEGVIADGPNSGSYLSQCSTLSWVVFYLILKNVETLVRPRLEWKSFLLAARIRRGEREKLKVRELVGVRKRGRSEKGRDV